MVGNLLQRVEFSLATAITCLQHRWATRLPANQQGA